MDKEGFERWGSEGFYPVVEIALWTLICFWVWVVIGVFIHADISILNPFTWLGLNRGIVLFLSLCSGVLVTVLSTRSFNDDLFLINVIRHFFYTPPKKSLEDELKEFEMWKSKFGGKE